MGNSPLKVAIVEDDNSLRELLTIRLGTQGFQVVDFATAEEAEVALKTDNVDVVLLDANLPKKLGVELAREMKEDEGYGNPKVIIITGVSFSIDDIKTKWKTKYLIDDYIEKPFEFSDLLSKITEDIKTVDN